MVDILIHVPHSFRVDRDEYGRQTMYVSTMQVDRAVSDLRKILDELVRLANIKADT